ncbi:MAG: DUF2815 family protein [Oscillospiraceae bacterium]|nr:DUF2815 family protein [Oscillospiraceae bacterium]
MSTKVVTGKVRFSFVNIWEPKEPQGGGDPKYSVTLLIPKADTPTMGKIKAAMAEARENFCKRNGANALPQKPVHTLHDGDGTRDNGEDYGPECKGCYVITVSSKARPVIVDSMGRPITDPGEVYSGCFGRAAINFYGYSRNGKKGISAGLLSIQKLHDGEPFGIVGSADDFNDGYVDPDGNGDDDFMA